LEQGAPPETIMRLMNSVKEGNTRPLMDNRLPGSRGNAAGMTSNSSRPTGIYGPSTPPRV
jgi:hypothetical protein